MCRKEPLWSEPQKLDKNIIKRREGSGICVEQVSGPLIYGRSDNWNDEQREAYRILNAAYNQLSILTYDHLLMRAKNVLGVIDDYMDEEDGELPF